MRWLIDRIICFVFVNPLGLFLLFATVPVGYAAFYDSFVNVDAEGGKIVPFETFCPHRLEPEHEEIIRLSRQHGWSKDPWIVERMEQLRKERDERLDARTPAEVARPWDFKPRRPRPAGKEDPYRW